MPLYMEMSQNINKTMRHLKFCYISILTNLLRTQYISYIYFYVTMSANNGEYATFTNKVI